ncbi:MAG TPA: lysine exporter LysO family protein [Clostridiales bacterium]|jgi:uncharacterized membrane protein YbjE (DUF340 family)|nr:lysine exporter LysO family protein [Clostridiales bacterium]
MSILPFACLAIGILLSIVVKSDRLGLIADKATSVILIILMLSIGIGIGLDKALVSNLAKIGLNCLIIALCAAFFSTLFTVLVEKTLLPLKEIDEKLKHQMLDSKATQEPAKGTPLVWIMPSGVVLGVLIGIFSRDFLTGEITDKIFIVVLVFLFISIGISLGANRSVFQYVKTLGLKIIWLPVAIVLGSLCGGVVAGLLLDLPFKIPFISASGMCFFSLTGAYMTSAMGVEAGAYGFLVNLLRDIITLLLMPWLIRISPGSLIAGVGTGNMDVMLAPVTKFIGVRLSLIAFLTGTILTFLVPFLLPLLVAVL